MKTYGTYAVSPGWRVLLRDLGVAPGPLLRVAGLPEDLLSRDAPRVTPAQYYALWEALAAGNPAAPLLVARALSVEAFDPALVAAVCSPDLNAAASRIAAFKPLLGPMRLDVVREEMTTTLRARWPVGAEPPAPLAMAELLFWIALARIATRVDVRPTAITGLAVPDDPRGFIEYAGVAPRVGAAWSVTFSALDGRRPFLTANEGLWRFFEPELRRRLADLEDGTSTGERVRAALVELLPAGNASMGAVARKLAVSERTLQRRLADDGLSFQGVLAGTREALARHYLERSRLPVAEVAFLLAYEDPNSFYRAFRAWTGETPEAVRLRRAE